jgi:hypothetical protein
MQNNTLSQIVEIARSDIKLFDILRPYCIEKFNVDIFDLMFPLSNPVIPEYTGSDSDWHFSDSPSDFSEVPSDNSSTSNDYYSGNHSACKNDASMHRDPHWCPRDCAGAQFICGCSYQNENGSWTKCGFISYSSDYSHSCIGSPDHYWSSSNPNSHTDYCKSSRKSRSRNNYSKSYYKS